MRPIARGVTRALQALGLSRDVARADGDTLVVVVPSSHWAGEIRLRERDLIAALQAHAPSSGIVRLRPTPASSPTR